MFVTDSIFYGLVREQLNNFLLSLDFLLKMSRLDCVVGTISNLFPLMSRIIGSKGDLKRHFHHLNDGSYRFHQNKTILSNIDYVTLFSKKK